MVNGRSSAGLEKAELPGVSSRGLKKQAKMKVTKKLLTTYCDSVSKRLKPEKVLTPPPSIPTFIFPTS